MSGSLKNGYLLLAVSLMCWCVCCAGKSEENAAIDSAAGESVAVPHDTLRAGENGNAVRTRTPKASKRSTTRDN